MSSQDGELKNGNNDAVRPTREQIRKDAAADSDLPEELTKGTPGQMPHPPYRANTRPATPHPQTRGGTQGAVAAKGGGASRTCVGEVRAV